MTIPNRPQQYRLSWPLDPSQVEGMDSMFETLFKRLRAISASAIGVGPQGVQGIPGCDGEDGDDAFCGSYGPRLDNFTLGSVIFAGPSGRLAQDNAKFFWDDTNFRLGLGTASPSFQLHAQVNTATFDLARFENLNNGATAEYLIDIGVGSTVYGRLNATNTGADPRFIVMSATTHPLVLGTAGGERLRLGTATDTFLSFGGQTTSFPALKRNSADLDVRLGDDSGYGILKLGSIRFGGTSSSFPRLTNNGALLKVRLADDSAYAGQDTGPLQINGNAALTNKVVYLTGSLSHSTPAMFYCDTGVTGIGGSGTETGLGMYFGASFALGGNAAHIVAVDIPAVSVTLNGHTLTDATSFMIEGAPTNGTTKRALWVQAGNSQFDGSVGVGNAPTALLHIKAGTATANTAPLKLTSGTNLTTAEAGAFEYDGTDLFFTRAGTVRENVLVAIDNVSAPTTAAGTPTTRYGGDTKYLGDPVRWLSVNVLGSTYKIPLYT